MAVEYLETPLKSAPSGAAGASVTPNGSSGVNSSWVEAIASASADLLLAGIDVQGLRSGSGFYDAYWEVDVGVGAAASEVVIATFAGYNGYPGGVGTVGSFCNHLLPILIDAIPSGSRVAVRLRRYNETDTTAWNISVLYYEQPITGNVTTTTQVLKVAPSNTTPALPTAGLSYANGSWVEILASAPADLVIVAAIVTGGANSAHFEIDLGKGAAASETVLTTLRTILGAGGGFSAGEGWIPLANPLDNVTSGTRIAVRARGSHPVSSGVCAVKIAYFEKPL